MPSEENNAEKAASAAKIIGAAAALAAGGILALRMRPASFLFLAGAAAAALIARKKSASSRPLQLLPPTPQPEEVPAPETPAEIPFEEPVSSFTAPPPPAPAPNPIEGWLARQLERERNAPIITLEVLTPEISPPAAESPPPPELPAVPEPEAEPEKPVWGSPITLEPETPFLEKTEPEAPAPKIAPPAPVLPAIGFHLLQALESTESSPTAPPTSGASAAWLLGIEPLPSWEESSSPSVFETPLEPLIPMDEAPFTTSVQETPAPPPPPEPAYVPPLFEGGMFPDEIRVDSPPEPPSLMHMEVAALETAAPEPTPLPLAPEPWFEQPTQLVPQPAEPTRVIPAPAVIDAPPSLVAAIDLFLKAPPPAPVPLTNLDELMPLDPAATALPVAPEAAETPPAAEPQPLSITPPFVSPFLSSAPPLHPFAPGNTTDLSPITPRPRGLSQTTVVPRHPFADPLSPAPDTDAAPPTNAEESPPIELPPAPVVLPREQKAKRSWRSWWRGD